MKKSRYYRQMALIDPAYADKYLEAAELWAKVEADQDRVDEDFQREERQVELETEAKRLNEVANRTPTESLVEEYLKPAAAQVAGLSPLVVGATLMKVPHPAAKVAGGGLLLADALFGLGSNAAAKTDAALHGEEQPAWQEPTTGDRVMAGALLAMPALRAISPTLSGVAGTAVGGGFMAEKVAATKAQLANAGLDSGIGDALAQTMTGPEIREIGMPGNQAVSSLMDAHMLRSGAGDLSHSKPVLSFLRKRGLGGAPEAIYRHAPNLSGFDSESGRIEIEKPDIRLHEVGSDDRARIKSQKLTPADIDALKKKGVDTTAFGVQSADKILINRAAIREAWENKQKIRLSEDESVVIDPREFKNLRDFRNAVVEHENQHIVTEGETPFKSGTRPWSRGGFEFDAGEKPTITALRRGVKQARFREEQQYPPEARDRVRNILKGPIQYAREKKDSDRELRTQGRVYSPRRSPEDTIDMWEREDRLNDVLPINPDRPKGKLQNIVKYAEVLPRPKPYYGVKRDEFGYGLRKSMSEFDKAATKPMSRKADLRDASFQIVPQKFGERIEGVIDGHRVKGKDITNAKPGEPGALGNPFVANDVRGGKLTRQQAVAQFERVFLDRVNRDKDFRDWVLSLRGKKVGYYKPDEEHLHLKVVQDWLREQSPAPRKVKLLDQWNSKEYGRQLEREEYEAARKKQMAEDNAAREEDGLGKGINPFKKDQPSYDSTYGDFLHAVRSGNISERDLPSDYPTLKAIARKTGLGKVEYISGEEATKSATMKQRILAALDDMTPQQIKEAFDRDGSKIYLPYSKNGNFPKDAVDIISDRLRNGEDVVLTTNSVHRGIHAKLTWDSKTREPVYDNQIYVAHDPATLLPKNSKMRYIATDHVTLTDEKLSGKLAEFDTLGEFVDWAAKEGIAKPYAKDAQGKTIVTNSKAADQTARAMAQHETAGESVRRPMFVDNRHYSPSEIARAIIDNTKLSRRIKELDKDTWMEYALEAIQGRTETELGITGKIKSRGPGIHEEKAIDLWIKSRKRMNPELMRVKNEMEIRKAFVQAKGCTSEEAGFYTDENGMVKFMGDSLWSVKEMQEFVKKNPPQKSSKTGGDRGYVDTTGEAEAEANAAEFGSDYTPVTSEIKSTTPGGSKIDLSSPTLWWKMARNSADKTPATVANFVARLDKELGGLQSESKAKIARILLDSALDPVSKAERLADEFTGKWQYAREAKGKKKQGLMAWGFLKMVDIAHAATSSLMSMLSGREFMIEALDKAVSAFDSLKSGEKNEFGEPVTMSTKLFRWTTDVSEKLPREKWSMMRYAWEVMARKSDGEGYFKKIRSRNAKGKDVMEYHASLTGIRNAIRNMISEAVGRSREVDEMVRSTNILSLRRKLANDDAAVTDFGTYLTNRDLIKTAKLTSDQRAFLEAGVKLHDGVMDFMKALDPNWKPRQNYVTQLLKDFDDGLISDVQKLSTAERYALGNRLKRELGIGEADEDFANAAMKYKHPTIHARVHEYMQKVREAIRSDKRNGEGTEMYDMDGAATNSLDTTINQLLEYKLNQLFGTGPKAEGKVSIEEMIGEAGQGPSALFKRKIFGYGDMQETHADILVQRLVQSAHKNYPYHDLYRAMAAFTNGKEAPAVLKSAMNAALPDGFARLQKWSTSAIQNTFLSGLTGDVKRPTAFSKFTDYLMGTTTSYDPHPNNAAAHYWTSVIYRNFLTRPQFFMMNATDPIIKTSFDGNFWEWATTVSRIYPQAIKEAVAARVTGKSSPLLSEAIKHIRAKGNVATELSGANLPSEQGAIFGNKAAKLGGIGLLFQKGWGTLTGGTEVQEHFNTASIWLIEAEKLLQRQIAKPKALIDQHGSLVRAAIEGKVNRETWNSVIKEATLRAEQRQGVGSDFMGKSEVFENFTATVGKNHPVMAMAIFARMFQNYPATVIAQLAKSTNRAILELRGKLDMTDTSSMTNILRTASPELLKAISPTALMMTAAVLSYQGGRAILTGQLTSSDYKEKDRKKQLKTVWSKLANIVGESGRLATRDLGLYQSMIPASFMKNIMLLASDPKVGASGLADMFIPGVFTGRSILRDAPKVPGLSSLFKKKKD